MPAAGRQRKFSPDVSTFDQHLGGNLPTPNINVLEGLFQQFEGSLGSRGDPHRHSTFSTFSTSLCHVTQREKGERPSTGQRTLCRWGRATWKDVTQERSTVTVGRRSHGLHPGASPSRFPRSLRPPRLASPPLSVSAARLSPTSWCRGRLRRMRPRHGAPSRAIESRRGQKQEQKKR